MVDQSAEGAGITDDYGGQVPTCEWHRLALVVNGWEARFISYIDGTEVQRKGLDVKDEYYNRRNDADGIGWTETLQKLKKLTTLPRPLP